MDGLEAGASEAAPVRARAQRARWFLAGALSALVLVIAAGGAFVLLDDRNADAERDIAAAAPPADAAADQVTTTATESTVVTTVAPSTTSTAVTAPPTSLPDGVAFLETFDRNAGLDRFDTHVFHRNVDIHDFDGLSGGTWSADHDLACGDPDTQRTMGFGSEDSAATRQANAFYTCRDHLMTTMGDVENYSIAAFSPAQVFERVSAVAVDVTLTDLGNRQWWKIGVLSVADCPALEVGCMYSDVAAADLPTDLATDGRLIVSWSGGLSGGYPGGLKIGNTGTVASFDADDDKRTRHPVALVDNGDGTVTFRVADRSATADGAFPACPCRVVFYDHNYTPDKNEAGPGTQYGYTWHWDNVEIRD
jgi:hypothetical protein